MRRRYRYYDLGSLMYARNMPIKIPITLYSLIATWFFVGRIPIASGTLGSIAFYPIYYFAIMTFASKPAVTIFLSVTTCVFFLVGWWAVSKFQSATNTFDHSYVVIDEVIGMSLSLSISYELLEAIVPTLYAFSSISSHNMIFIITCAIFRVYDITKPLFIGYIDRNYKKPFGVILDDILAALLTGGTIFITYKAYELINYYM